MLRIVFKTIFSILIVVIVSTLVYLALSPIKYILGDSNKGLISVLFLLTCWIVLILSMVYSAFVLLNRIWDREINRLLKIDEDYGIHSE